jgi:hypothetical protein
MFNISLNERIKRIPVYMGIIVFVMRFKKFPYYMEFEMFRKEKVIRQICYILGGVVLCDLIWDTGLVIYRYTI